MGTTVFGLWSFMFLWSFQAVAAPTMRAEVREVGDPNRELLFQYHRTKLPSEDAGVRYASEFRLPEGGVFLAENLVVQGAHFNQYSLDFPLLKESARVWVEGGKVHLRYSIAGVERAATEEWSEDYVVAPTLVDRVQKNWEALMAGKSVRVRMVVPDRLQSFGFKFVRDSETVLGGRKAELILFKPTSFFVSLVVRPLKFYFDSSTRVPLKIVGRTILKKRVGTKWDDFQSETLFTY